MTRSEFVSSVVGKEWDWRSFNCWSFATYVQRELFGRDLPAVAVPTKLDKRWVLREFDGNAERTNWVEVQPGPYGTITADDGALVLMAHASMPAHIGVWLKPEGRVIHCSETHGVCFETVLALQQMGWRNLKFIEPRT